MTVSDLSSSIRASGVTFYENFKSNNVVQKNLNPTIVGKPITNGLFVGGNGNYLEYNPYVLTLQKKCALFFRLKLNSALGGGRFFTSNHSLGASYKWRSFISATEIFMTIPVSGTARTAPTINYSAYATEEMSVCYFIDYNSSTNQTFFYSYFNGALVSSNGPWSGFIDLPDIAWWFGYYGSAGTYVDGCIFEVIMLNNVDILASDVLTLHNSSLVSYTKNNVFNTDFNSYETTSSYAKKFKCVSNEGVSSGFLGSDGLSAAQIPLPKKHGGIYLDGTTEYLSIPNTEITSFGDGTSENAFTGFIYVDIQKRTGTIPLIGKGDTSNSGWFVNCLLSGSNIIYEIYVYNSTLASYMRAYTTDMKHFVGVKNVFAFSYDGSGVNTGLKLFINGVDVTSSRTTSGTYTAMNDSSSSLLIGKFEANYLKGSIYHCDLYRKLLSPLQIRYESDIIKKVITI